MTVKGKVGGAATAVLAPEAAAAGSATGASAGAGTGMVPGSRKKPRSNSAAFHRAEIDKIKAQRPADTASTPDDQQEDSQRPSRGRRAWESTKAAATDQTGAPAWYQTVTHPEPVKAANAGGGFLLGVMGWMLARAYLTDGGSAGVKRLLKAKFLNKVDG